jgi:hypothetical protein
MISVGLRRFEASLTLLDCCKDNESFMSILFLGFSDVMNLLVSSTLGVTRESSLTSADTKSFSCDLPPNSLDGEACACLDGGFPDSS